MSMFHRDAPTGDIHKIHQWTYANAAAKAAATGFASSDVGKVALQEDTATYYILTDESPVTWQAIGSAVAGDITSAVATHAALTATHGATGAVVGTTNTQTLTNKTLTSPVINSPTGIVKGDVGLGNVDNTSDATKNSATATLTNKDIDGGTASNSNRITLPKASTSTLNGLTRKQGTIAYDTDRNKAVIDNGSALVPVGSGSGGGLNLLTLNSSYSADNSDDADAESSVGRWTQYADSAATEPVDMTGGSPGSTAPARSTSSPLNGTASIVWDLGSGSSRQGEGMVLGPVYVPPGYRGRTVQLSAVFANTGTIVDGDVVIRAYDITNSAVIVPYVSGKVLGSAGKLQANFTIPSTCAQLRVGLHVARTSTGALSIKTDDWKLTDEVVPVGKAGSGRMTYTPTISGLGSATASLAEWQQDGEDMVLSVKITAGTPAPSEMRCSLPTGSTIRTDFGTQVVSHAATNANGSVSPITVIATGGLTYLTFGTGPDTGASNGQHVAQNGNAIIAASDVVSFTARFPIQGWSANASMSNAVEYKISSYLANGTRVTGTAPTKLGEYRTYLRNAGAITFTETNGAPTATPSLADGMRIYRGNAFSAADTNNSPTRYEIFIGKNKTYRTVWYAAAGRSGFCDPSKAQYSSTASAGYDEAYDASTGILRITAFYGIGSETTREGGRDGIFGNIADPYFDVIVNEGAAPVGMQWVAPLITKYTSGSGTHTLTNNPRYIRVRMVGGGGGGAGSGTASQTAGGAGGSTTFGTSLLVANGGSGGVTTAGSNGGAGGSASLGSGPTGTALTGGSGGANSAASPSFTAMGGSGASSAFGGSGGSGSQGTAGSAAAANTGAGGGGGGISAIASGATGSGGGAGGFIDAIIASPASSYAYSVGAAGTAGTAGTSGFAGGAGGSGYIEVTEYYQ